MRRGPGCRQSAVSLRLPAAILAAFALVAVPIAGEAGATESPRVQVRDLTVASDGGVASRFGGRVDVTVRFRVVNTGSQPVEPTARIKLESQIGGGATSAPIDVGSLAPGEHVDVTRTAGSLLPFGSAHVEVTVRADGEAATATAATPVIPWFLLLAGVVAIAAAVVFRFRARRPKNL